MKENVVAQFVGDERVILVMLPIEVPIVRELLRAQNEDVLIPFEIIFHDGERGKGLAESDAVGENAPVVLFQLTDNGDRGVPLELIEFVPDRALFESFKLFRQLLLRSAVERRAENMVNCDLIEKFRGIILINGGDALDNVLRNVEALVRIGPEGIEESGVQSRGVGGVELRDGHERATRLAPERDRVKVGYRKIPDFVDP